MGRPFRILSLDGGGIRGAFAASFLAEVERRVGRPVAEHFDLIAGTSTGGIIATCLALGESAQRVDALYQELGRSVFVRARLRRPSWHLRASVWLLRKRISGVDADWLIASKFSSAPLRQALEGVLGARTLEEATRRLVVPAIDVVRGQTVVFKTPHLPGLVRDRRYRAVDVAMATSAAPTYFSLASIHEGSAYCDGALWANNPAVVAFAEAARIRQRCTRPGVDLPFELNDVYVLSVGTGEPRYSLKLQPGDDGLLCWAPHLVDVGGTSQSQGTGFLAQYLLDDRYVRVNFGIPDRTWALDRADILPELVHLGREAATERLAELQGIFFTEATPAFTPFAAEQV